MGWGHRAVRAGMHGGGMMKPGVFGTVSAVSGNTITVTSKAFGNNHSGAPTSYTIDATNATVIKNGATSTVGAIAVGDTIMAQGTVSDTSVTATTIRDGMPQGGMMHQGQGWRGASSTPANIPQGNGQPVIGGTITAISGTTLTVTNKSNVTYTVDASGATITKTGTPSATISSVIVGDNVIVQGTVNGTSVVASSVIDNAAPSTGTTGTPRMMGGFFGAIGGIFHRLFGFF